MEALKGIDLDGARGRFLRAARPERRRQDHGDRHHHLADPQVRPARCSVFGHDIEREREAAKSCIGVVPQEINLNMFERNDLTLINQAGYYGVPAAVARERAPRST